jgi:hypothetical protein
MAQSSGKAGSLFYGMTLDTKEFKKRLKDVRKTLKSAGEEMRETFTMVSTGFVAVGASIVAATSAMLLFAKSTAEANNEQILLADSIGSTQSEIAGLELAAQKMGVETSMLIDKVREFGGVDSFKKYADQVANAGNEQQQLNKAIEIFGGEGAKMLTILQGGAAGLDAMEQEAIALGLALNPRQIEQNNVAWAQFEDTVVSLQGLGKQIGTDFNQFFGTAAAGVEGLTKAFGDDLQKAFAATSNFLTESMNIAFQWFADNGIPFINGFINFAQQIGNAFADVFSFILGEGEGVFDFFGELFDGFVDFMATFKQTLIAGFADTLSIVFDGVFGLLADFSDFIGDIVTNVASLLESIGLEESGFAKLVEESFQEQGDSLRNIGKEWAEGLKIISEEQTDEAASMLEDQREKNERQRKQFTSVIDEFNVSFAEASKVAVKAAEKNKDVANSIIGASEKRAGLATRGSQEEFMTRQQEVQIDLEAQQLAEQKKTNRTLNKLEVM